MFFGGAYNMDDFCFWAPLATFDGEEIPLFTKSIVSVHYILCLNCTIAPTNRDLN